MGFPIGFPMIHGEIFRPGWPLEYLHGALISLGWTSNSPIVDYWNSIGTSWNIIGNISWNIPINWMYINYIMTIGISWLISLSTILESYGYSSHIQLLESEFWLCKYGPEMVIFQIWIFCKWHPPVMTGETRVNPHQRRWSLHSVGAIPKFGAGYWFPTTSSLHFCW